MSKIYWKKYKVLDLFSKEYIYFEGWAIKGQVGIYSDYAFAVAANMDLHEEYCEYHRKLKPNKGEYNE